MSPETLQLSPGAAHALWATSYDQSPNPLVALEERTVEPLLPRIEGIRTLDVACGTARWLGHLVRRGARTAVGLDLSREMLKQAWRKPGLGEWLVEGDATAMPFGRASVDFAICSLGLSYITDIHRFAKELSRVVQNGGCLVLTDLHPSAQARGWKRSFRHEGNVVEISSVARSLTCVQETLATEGFEILVCLEPGFGEAESPIFEKCGKGALFQELVGQAAIYVGVFRKVL